MHYFLDIDGVLNTREDWKKQRGFIRKSCIEALAKIIDSDSDPHIILSSTWRMGVDNAGKTVDAGPVSEALSVYGMTIEGTTPVAKDHTRQEEIEYYVKRHSIEEYVILDDDPSLFSSDCPHLHLVNADTGLTEADTKTLVNISKKKRRFPWSLKNPL